VEDLKPLESAWAHSFPHRSFKDIGANGERVDALFMQKH
jgi:hypothetical protein